MSPWKVLHLRRLWALVENIKLVFEGLRRTNALAYSSEASVTRKEKFGEIDRAGKSH
jgi:hypothetical protein